MTERACQPVAIVTGAGSGIGAAIVRRLAANDFAVVLVGRREGALRCAATAAAGTTFIVPGDLAVEAVPSLVVAKTIERFGRIDVLVNNAGCAPALPIESTSPETLRTCIQTNLIAPMLLLSACWPHFLETQSGCVVNVSSMASLDPFSGFLAYAASKAGLDSLARSIVAERPTDSIRAFTLNPGAVETELLRAIADENIVGREACLTPDDIAKFALQCVLGEHDDRQATPIELRKEN